MMHGQRNIKLTSPHFSRVAFPTKHGADGPGRRDSSTRFLFWSYQNLRYSLFWDVTQRGLLVSYRHFWKIYRFHLQVLSGVRSFV